MKYNVPFEESKKLPSPGESTGWLSQDPPCRGVASRLRPRPMMRLEPPAVDQNASGHKSQQAARVVRAKALHNAASKFGGDPEQRKADRQPASVPSSHASPSLGSQPGRARTST